MRMKWLPAGIGLFLVGMSVVSFADGLSLIHI